MEILPVLNFPDEQHFKEKLSQVKSFLPVAKFVHVDVADGSFTKGYSTWITPAAFPSLFSDDLPKVSLHIMSNSTEQILDSWLAVKPARVIVHFDSLQNSESVAKKCKDAGVEVYLAITLKTDMESFFAKVADFSGALVLAVEPGLSGQEFQPAALLQISAIHEKLPSLPICVDGGVNIDVVRACARAGAKQLAVGAHIFRQQDPAATYGAFVQIAKE